jgi:glycosyltransferase involved in cell wall biosynthesis
MGMVEVSVVEDKIPLSVAIITKNEAENLHDCLMSVAFAGQTVIVDSGSTDNTMQIARDFGCDVCVENWRGGFGAQKQLAIDRCRHDWALVLDADERIPPETARIVKSIIKNPSPDIAGYSFPRKNFFQGRWIRRAGWWPDRVVRLFRKGRGRMTDATVHEAVVVDGTVEALNWPIEHLTESDLGKILQKIDHYSTLGAEQAFAEGKRATVWSAAGRANLTFLQDYIVRLGFLDGSPGLILAITDAINKFFKYAKLSDLIRESRQHDPRENRQSSP